MVNPPPIELANLGMADSLILMVLALVVFGPRRLPQIGRQIGKLMYEFRKASNDFKYQMEEEMRNAEEADRRKKEEERQRAIAAQAADAQASVSADPPKPVNAIESPYPGEGTYPPSYPPESPAQALPAADSTPRIMPPSTGDIVAASKPVRHTESTEPAGESQIEAGNESLLESPPNSSGTHADIAPPLSKPSNESADAAEALNQHG
jgi:sec-independent protein translocase protein TatB